MYCQYFYIHCIYDGVYFYTVDIRFTLCYYVETGQGKTFPDYDSSSVTCSLRNGDSFFGNELNFAAVPQMIVTGAA